MCDAWEVLTGAVRQRFGHGRSDCGSGPGVPCRNIPPNTGVVEGWGAAWGFSLQDSASVHVYLFVCVWVGGLVNVYGYWVAIGCTCLCFVHGMWDMGCECCA